jgi:alkanesulfonate monooxygenase SsuD/methylene tetrahydromethanopterin reductase-like flavin-dependent oxidoreductase (luciferase family)
VLDQLTEGRLDFGVGRGAVPIEHHWFDRDFAQSRERFVDVLGIIERALRDGEISSQSSQFYDFPPMPLATKPFQDRIPFWYPGNPKTARRHGMSLMWPGKIDQAAYEQYIEAWHEHEGEPIRLDGPGSEPRVAYTMLLSIAPSEDEALDIARRGMEGLVRRTRNSHQFDRLVLPLDECQAAQRPLRASIANMEAQSERERGHPARSRSGSPRCSTMA